MSVIIRLQNLPLTANSIDIRNFFRGLGIPDGGVHIVGGSEGDAFIAFSTDEDARQGMQLSGTCLKDSPVKLFLSSRNEMYKVIEQARQQALGLMPVSSSSSSPSENSPLPSSQPSQQTSTASIHSQSSTNTLPLSMAAAAGNSMLPGLGLPYHGANSNSNPPVSFPGIGGPLGAGSVSMGPTNFSGSIGSQGNVAGGYPPVFSPQQTTGPPLVPNSLAGPRNMNPMNMNQMSQNPFVMSQSTSGNNIPIGFPSTMPNGPITSNMMGSAAANPNLIGMPSSNVPMLSGSNQFGLGTGSRMPMLNAGSGNLPGGMISPFSMGQGPQSGYTGLNPNLMSSTSNNIGNGNHTGGSMGGSQVRPNFHQNNASLPNRDNRRLGDRPASNFDRPVSNFGKPNAGPMTPMRERDNMGFNARVADRDTRGRERERGERVKRSQSRSRDRKDARDRSRRRSRSREGRDRSRERRRTRRSKSRSRSRDRERTRSRRGSSRDRDRGRDERRRSDAGSGGSPEKGMKSDGSPAVKFGSLAMDAEKKYLGKDRRDSSVENIVVTITDESSPCAKLSGLSKDTSFREIREFVRVDIQGGGEGVVRNYDKGLAFLKLENPSEFPRLLRQNGLKLRGNLIRVEGTTLDVWENEYRINKRQQEKEKEREKELRERDRDRDRDRDHRERDRSDTREGRERPRTSRFNGGASSQSNCITIRGLPPAITTKDVASKFFRDINVVDIVCLPSESATTGRVTMTAFVQLDSLISAQRAVDVIVKSPEGANFPVDFCELEDVQRAKREAFGGRVGSTRDYKGPGEAKSLFELDIGLDMDSSSVVISGVPPQTNERSVLDFFSEIGLTPLSVRMTYDQNGMPNGQVICEFADPSKARRATTKDGTLFGRIPVKVSLMPSGNSHNRNINPSHMGPLAGNQNSQFPSRGTRPSLLGARPAIPNSNTPRFQSNHQSQNPFTQALQQSMPSPNNSNMMVNVPRLRGPVGERSTRFSNNTSSGGGGGEREDRSKHGVSRHDDMAPFENPGCVLALENVPFKASMDDILNFLKDMLKIQIPRSRIIRRFDDNQKPTGDARVAFDTPFEAKLAYQRLLGSTMWKRQISVSILNYF